jgi:N-acetylmuramoyl-L-alanine amidase
MPTGELKKVNNSGREAVNETFFLLDPGHAGLHKGVYETPGKRSPEFDGKVLYEGVQNRKIVNLILEKAERVGIDAIDIVNSNRDISLGERVRRANEIGREVKCVYISIHANAAGPGGWYPASGIEIFTSKGQTKSDVFAEMLISRTVEQFEDTVKWRFNTTDSDRDKEANFKVLRDTTMPAVLAEFGFMTDEDEVRRMDTDEWRNQCADAVVNAMIDWVTTEM